MDAEQWRPFLKRWSEEWIAAHDPENDEPLDEAVVRDSWLGFAPATEEEIAAAETRLGVSLPPSLREFLAVTNGWRDAGEFVYQLAGPAELGWLRDMDSGAARDPAGRQPVGVVTGHDPPRATATGVPARHVGSIPEDEAHPVVRCVLTSRSR